MHNYHLFKLLKVNVVLKNLSDLTILHNSFYWVIIHRLSHTSASSGICDSRRGVGVGYHGLLSQFIDNFHLFSVVTVSFNHELNLFFRHRRWILICFQSHFSNWNMMTRMYNLPIMIGGLSPWLTKKNVLIWVLLHRVKFTLNPTGVRVRTFVGSIKTHVSIVFDNFMKSWGTLMITLVSTESSDTYGEVLW